MINKDELQENASRWTTRLTLWLKALWGLFLATFPYSLILVLIVAAGIFIGWLTWQSTSKNEQAAEQAGTNSILAESNSNTADKNAANKQRESDSARESVREAGKASQKASKEREKATQTDSSEGKDRDAQARFCDRFPNDSTCIKK